MDHAAHAGHNHAAHAGAAPEVHHPDHGSFEGHLLPGVMFIIWATYWTYSIFTQYLTKQKTALLQRRAFRSQAWYPWPYWPVPHLEPIIKVVLSVLGVLVELRLGHSAWRPLYKAGGHFEGNHLNNWQHALMYGGVAISGAVDLLGHYTSLPDGTQQAFLSLAFLNETLLMGLHMKHNDLDKIVHLLLTSLMVACIVVTALEVVYKDSFLLATARPLVVFLQGTWFIQAGSILFKGNPAWDMHDMAAVMFVPVVFCLHILLACMGFLTVFLLMRFLLNRNSKGGSISTQPSSITASPHLSLDAELELIESGLEGGDVQHESRALLSGSKERIGKVLNGHRNN